MIPEELAASLDLYWPTEGRRWFDKLPGQIAHYLDQWSCQFDRILHGASTAFVARVRRGDGSPAVLKITYPEIRGECEALHAYGEHRAVAVFEAEGNALLLEWCDPGTALRDAVQPGVALSVTVDLMRELWTTQPFSGVATLSDQCRHFVGIGRETLRERPDLTNSAIERGITILEGLGNTRGREVLLHGDLHPGNILQSTRRPWLVIDPKPLLGDPAYETIPLLLETALSPAEHRVQTEFDRRISDVASRLELDPGRIALWGAARRCDWALFCHRAGRREHALLAEAQLQSFLRSADTFGAVVPT